MNDHVHRATPYQRRTAVILFLATVTALGVVVGGIFLKAALELPAAQGAKCVNNLSQIQIALLSYHDVYGSFPPAYLADADGKPMHSWRVLILPYLDEGKLFAQYDFDEPWNGPHNRQLADKLSFPHFNCPSSDAGAEYANYLGVVGPEAGFVGDQPRGLRDIYDGPHKTVAVVEVADSDVHWMEPRDLTLEQAARGINVAGGISADHPSGANAAYWDAHIDRLPEDKDLLRAVLTARGGDDFEYPYDGFGDE